MRPSLPAGTGSRPAPRSLLREPRRCADPGRSSNGHVPAAARTKNGAEEPQARRGCRRRAVRRVPDRRSASICQPGGARAALSGRGAIQCALSSGDEVCLWSPASGSTPGNSRMNDRFGAQFCRSTTDWRRPLRTRSSRYVVPRHINRPKRCRSACRRRTPARRRGRPGRSPGSRACPSCGSVSRLSPTIQ